MRREWLKLGADPIEDNAIHLYTSKRVGVQAPQLVESLLERGKVDKRTPLIHLFLFVEDVPPLSGQRLQCSDSADQNGTRG